MNEENSVMNNEKPRKKKRSLWWLWFLLILAAFAGGIVCGLKINTLPLPNEVRDRLYPVLESYIPGSTTPRTPEAAPLTPVPDAAEIPEKLPEPEETLAPEETAAFEQTPAPAETPAVIKMNEQTAEETAVIENTPASEEPKAAEVFNVSDTATYEAAPEPAKKYIGVGAALEIALQHAGVAETDAEISGVYRTKDDDGEPVYEVSFKADDISYDYMIGAYDGEIAGWKMSGFTFADDAAFAADFSGNEVPETAVTAAPVSQPLIGEENAKEIAFNHAAVKTAEVLRSTAELNGEVYNVEFKTASRLFHYEIDAHTGEILGSEVTK